MGQRPRSARLPVMLLQRGSSRPLHRQLYESLRNAILSGDLAATARLPSTRALANALGISRNTVLNAYEQLYARNYLIARTGSGTLVSAGPRQELGRPLIPAQAFISPSRKQQDRDVPSILKQSHYPVQRVNLEDPDGSSLYFYISEAAWSRGKL